MPFPSEISVHKDGSQVFHSIAGTFGLECSAARDFTCFASPLIGAAYSYLDCQSAAKRIAEYGYVTTFVEGAVEPPTSAKIPSAENKMPTPELPSQEVTLAEFVAECQADIARFHANWERERAKNPEHFPTAMGAGDWFDQFLSFVSTGDKDNNTEKAPTHA